ncbi:hypothetical protein INT47_004465 [Mucor saturninus]|uniref:Uncharacterized protein n=1 Tax=Mucor saturninus TaxID=64648 RepID=A0A8H7QVE0_9FUNG|nr:hypothetical protein INT47_004465 [Mucor saturninus]
MPFCRNRSKPKTVRHNQVAIAPIYDTHNNFLMGIHYYEIKDYPTAMLKFELASKEPVITNGAGVVTYNYAPGSYFYMGNILMQKNDIKKSDFSEALKFFQMSIAAAAGDPQYNDDIYNIMGNICKHGDDTYRKNYEHSISHYMKAHETGKFPEASFRIGELCFLLGEFDRAKHWFERSISLMSSRGINKYSRYINLAEGSLASILLHRQLYNEAYHAFKKLLGRYGGIPEYNIGLLLKKNLVPNNINSPHEKYFIASAEQGCSYGQHYCGLMKEQKGGYRDAMEFYKKALAQFDGKAANSIGNIYYNGNSEYKSDKHLALEYYKKAMSYNFSEARFNVALTLRELGLDTMYALTLYEEYYKDARSSKRYEACLQIAKIYEDFKDNDRSMKWCQMAADHGIAEAQLIIGKAFLNGTCFDRVENYDLAYKYLRNAERNGFKEATPLAVSIKKYIAIKKRPQDVILYKAVVESHPVFAGRSVTFSYRTI